MQIAVTTGSLQRRARLRERGEDLNLEVIVCPYLVPIVILTVSLDIMDILVVVT